MVRVRLGRSSDGVGAGAGGEGSVGVPLYRSSGNEPYGGRLAF